MKYIVIILCYVLPFSGKAQNNKRKKIFYQYKNACFPLVSSKNAANIYLDSSDAAVVKTAANIFSEDVFSISGKSPSVKTNAKVDVSYPVIIGTIGKSLIIDELISEKKISATDVKGKWETFSIAIVEKPFKNVKQALVIYGVTPEGQLLVFLSFPE